MADEQHTSSRLALAALVLSIAAIVTAAIPFVVFISPLIILAALIVSIIALVKKAGKTGVRITSLILSIVAIPVSIVMFFVTIVMMIPPFFGTTLNSDEVEATVTTGVEEQFGVSATVVCPDSMAGTEGTTFECVATDASGVSQTVIVTIKADAWYWELAE